VVEIFMGYMSCVEDLRFWLMMVVVVVVVGMSRRGKLVDVVVG
jgi:hypothetical protein